MRLLPPQPVFEKARDLIGKIESNWESVELPTHITDTFAKAWEDQIQHQAQRSTGITRLYTSEDRSENVADVDLALGIAVTPLWQLLHSYRAEAVRAVTQGNVDAFWEDYKSKVQGNPQCWEELRSAIESLDGLDDEGKMRLKSFLTDSEQFYGIKGIARGDFATPALCRAARKRTDRFSIINQIAEAASQYPSIYEDLENFISDIDAIEKSDTLVKEFSAICDFCEGYEARETPIKTSDPECQIALDSLKKITAELKNEYREYKGVQFEVRFSKGSGNFPRVPWIGIMPPGQTPKSGIYFSMCFGREGNGAVAGLAESVQNRGRLETKIREQESKQINANGGDPKQHYNDTFENPMEIFKDSFSIRKLKEHVAISLDRAIDHLDLRVVEVATGIDVLQSCESSARDTGLSFDKALVKRLIASLCAKPFTILTGNSGTGKTKLAEILSSHISSNLPDESAIVAVGSDWTDNRNVTGYVNHLREVKLDGGEIKPLFQATKILNLLLHAHRHPAKPHFLILDEMNLSHVERYFSDFLSAMERPDGGITLHNEGNLEDPESMLPRSSEDAEGVPRELTYPQNLFVIGTVNIDETTYMFSPKVLDRANVIEFKVSEEDIRNFLSAPQTYNSVRPAKAGIAEGFLEMARKARNLDCDVIPRPTASEIGEHLLNLFKILQVGRFEFAYRSASEITIYLQVCRYLASDKAAWDEGGWESDLDDQVLQKLLPKLHGSIGRIGSLLAALAEYCQNGASVGESKVDLDMALKFRGGASAKFPKSLAKLQAMIRTLQDEQFASFIQ